MSAEASSSAPPPSRLCVCFRLACVLALSYTRYSVHTQVHRCAPSDAPSARLRTRVCTRIRILAGFSIHDDYRVASAARQDGRYVGKILVGVCPTGENNACTPGKPGESRARQNDDATARRVLSGIENRDADCARIPNDVSISL